VKHMKKRKAVMGPGKRKVYLAMRRIITAAACAILFILWINSSITVETNGRLYSQNIQPIYRRDHFEDSSLFRDILQEEIRAVTRNAVIRSQLETDGSYNGQRVIDIAEYAQRQEDLPETRASAQYYLDDLVKWGNFGFVTESVYATMEELDYCFKTGKVPEMIFAETDAQSGENAAAFHELETLVSGQKTKTLSMQMITYLASSQEEYLQKAKQQGKIVSPENVAELQILVPRYFSVQDKDLAEYASSAEEYKQLREDLKTTSKELFYNFSEYSENRGLFGKDSTNIRYCYRMSVDGEVLYFTNLEHDMYSKKLDEITGIFRDFGKYVYYNADRSEIETNTGIAADTMKQELSYYQYAFGDNTRIWIAVDTKYPVMDAFTAAKSAFDNLMPFYWYLAAAFGVLACISILLFCRIVKYEGRVWQEEAQAFAIALTRSDRVYTEPFILGGLIVVAGWIIGCSAGYLYLANSMTELFQSSWMPLLIGIAVFCLDLFFMFFFLSLVRRCKAGVLWKNSLLRFLGCQIRKFILELYDNSHILVGTLLPFMALLLVNLILGACDVWGMLLAAVMDTVAIWILYRKKKALEYVIDATQKIGQGDFLLKIDLQKLHGENRILAEAVNGLGDGIAAAVEKSMKDERLKADLITNVSHDIKTPLTSIINFVKLLKRERIEDERIRGYIEVLDTKSQRLRQLTEDLVEASKISSGNISLQMERINFTELIHQTCGEFSDKLRERCLETVLNVSEKPVYIEADPRRIWRVAENLFSNVCKYALEGTRVYLDIRTTVCDGKEMMIFSMKNISAQALNIDASELTERFIRGDISRSTEGSGLGLSIAKNLTQLQNGEFEIYLDGDLFKVILRFPCLSETNSGIMHN